jgi:hypothetical protein
MRFSVSLYYVGHDKAVIERRVRIKIGHERIYRNRAGWLRRLPGEGQQQLVERERKKI